jgi:hypothetical protein
LRSGTVVGADAGASCLQAFGSRQALAGKHLQAGDVAIQADHSRRQDRAVDVLDLGEITHETKLKCMRRYC